MKKISLYLVMLFVASLLTGCKEEVTTGPESLQECRTKGIYEATIVELPLKTDAVVEWYDPDMWVWCEITKAPEDAKFPGQVLKPGMTVKFRIYCLALILQDKNEYPFAFSPDRQYYYGFVMHE